MKGNIQNSIIRVL